jgi:hypothetical protein
MKSAYEIAMERLNKKLNAEIARAADDVEKENSLRDQLVHERKKLQAELQAKKERVRSESSK